MKLVVIGGVAAGMSTAARARRLDESAEIVVLEKSHHVSFANCGLPYHIGGVIKERDRLLLQTPESLRESLNLDVRTAHEVLSIDPKSKSLQVRNLETGAEYTESYDKLAYCPGAEAMRPPIPGLDLPGVHVLRRIGDMDQIKKRVDFELEEQVAGRRGPVQAVVVGAGYIGLEMAENLAHIGVKVTVVELSDQILPPIDKEMSIPVENHLRGRGIKLHLSTAAAAISEKGKALLVELTSGVMLDADLVVMSAGVRPATALAKAAGIELGERGGIKVDAHMQTNIPDIYAAGDVVETPHTVLPGQWLAPLAGPANRQGRVVGENVCGRSTTYKHTQGTSIVKVFDMVAGGTGATEKQLIREGVLYRKIHIHPSGHAGYYPGTSTMHIKLLFDNSGRILGAQACGFDGVDKRLDVLATALRSGMSVFELQDVELSYAPPFGSAKDPINMAGFVASNVLLGDVKLWYAEQYPDQTAGKLLVDVRTKDEYDIWHIPGAENVPLAKFRELTEDWDRSQPIRLYCGVGFRSYLAYRSLVQRGFTDVETLSGGSTTFRYYHEVTSETEALPAPVLNYAETESLFKRAPAASGITVDLDCTGLACPGPIMKLSEKVKDLKPGDEITIHVSDPGFANDGPAWCSRNGHELVAMVPEGSGYAATIRKGGAGALVAAQAAATSIAGPSKTSFVVFSGDLDKLIASFIIANGALAMGEEVSMFFTFWGLNSLRKKNPPRRQKKLMEKMFSTMMPSGADSLKLSQMHMAGAGTAMIKSVMKKHNVQSLPELMAAAQKGGARIIACTMTMDLLGIAPSDLMDGIEFGGVASFLGEAAESQTTLFI
jgi:NADPH-dependent 2,4-dienoyl-CoA reductase/sulfur reductase-like enzyme/peroxiredoxin family protein/TusA-related sulfurtransferase/rhodanese-related sulfurtransferase